MTEQPKPTTPLDCVLSWLPESVHAWANACTALSVSLPDLLNQRDACILGEHSSSNTTIGLVALLEQLRTRKSDSSMAVIVAPSADRQWSLTEKLRRLSEKLDLSIATTAGVLQSVARLGKAVTPAPDVLVTDTQALLRMLDGQILDPECIKTLFIVDADTLDQDRRLEHLSALSDVLPAARQFMATALPNSTVLDRLTELLQAPVFCRAPDAAARPRGSCRETIIVLDEEAMNAHLIDLTQRQKSLVLLNSPTRGNALKKDMDAAKVDCMRITAQTAESTREKNFAAFAAADSGVLVMPHRRLFPLPDSTVTHIVEAELPADPQTYLDHLNLIDETGGSYTVLIHPDECGKLDTLLRHLNRQIIVLNPRGLADIAPSLGLCERREKLTVRPAGAAAAEATPADQSETTVAVSDDTQTESHSGHRHQDKPARRNNGRRFNKRRQNADKRERNDADAETSETARDTAEPTSPKAPRKAPKKRFNKRRDNDRRTDEAQTPRREDDAPQAPAEAADSKPKGHRNERRLRTPFKRHRYNKDRRSENRADNENTDQKPAAAPQDKADEKPARFDKRRKNARPNKPTRTAQAQAPQDEQTAKNERRKPNRKHRDTPRDNDAVAERHPRKNARHDKKFDDNKKAPRVSHRSRQDWDDDNFGNSIHYQPRRQNLRNLRSDEPLHWEPVDPFHPASQALSLPQMMPDEYPNRGFHSNDRNKNGRRTPAGGKKRHFHKKRGPQ